MTTGRGCTVCGSIRTATIDGACGRRCAEHPPAFSRDYWRGLVADGLDPDAYLRTLAAPLGSGYRRDLAALLVDVGSPDAALAYLRCCLAAEIDVRFDRALARAGAA